MENGIVTVFASIATVMVVLAILLGFGKKYHDEDLKDGYFDEIYFGGNQEIRLLIKKVESNSTNELFEMLQNKGLRLGQIFENIRKENDDDLFNISDEKFHQELVKMFEKTV